ncbi:hypothetical protein AAHA92_27042 [Salvia divinorum]|uniref:Uncharacterized protein n=1 Tax=Salvia divinorum TaxID=28513 RepID=A0ABD1G2F1_SALDI
MKKGNLIIASFLIIFFVILAASVLPSEAARATNKTKYHFRDGSCGPCSCCKADTPPCCICACPYWP